MENNERPRDTDAMQSREYTIIHSSFYRDARRARGAHLVEDLLYHLNQVHKHILIRHVFLNCFHSCRHQHIDVTYTLLVVLPSRRYCPYQQKVLIIRSLLQSSVFYHGSQQTF